VEATFHLTACVGYILMAALSILLPLSLYFRTQIHWPLTAWLEGAALLATTLSLGVFYAVCQRDLYPDWKSRLRNLPLMISVGVGMCLSNTKAVLQGLTHRRFEFRRTPKYSVVEKDRSWKKKQYRSRNPTAGLIEFFFAVYFGAALYFAYDLKQWISLPFIALFAYGYGYVAFLTAMHGVSSWRPALLFNLVGKALPIE